MCKIMQNIANHVLFTKEVHMKTFNEFLRANFDVAQQLVGRERRKEGGNGER